MWIPIINPLLSTLATAELCKFLTQITKILEDIFLKVCQFDVYYRDKTYKFIDFELLRSNNTQIEALTYGYVSEVDYQEGVQIKHRPIDVKINHKKEDLIIILCDHLMPKEIYKESKLLVS